MNNQEKQALFDDLVTKHIVCSEVGTIELPVAGLMDFHEAAGLDPTEMCYITLTLPETTDGTFNYILGTFADDEATIQIAEAYFFDIETGDSANIGVSKDLLRILKRYLAEGEVYINGDLLIDQFGRIWVPAMMTDDIGVEIIVTLNPEKMGVPIYYEDMNWSSRIWYDGKTLFYVPTTIFYSDNYLPS